MTSMLNRVAGSGDPVSPEACNRKVAGVRRPRSLRPAQRIQAHGNRQGGARLCTDRRSFARSISRRFPATYRTAPAIKYLVELRDAEVWLAPIAGTRVLVPFRFSMPTPLGTGVLQATQFVSVAQPSHPRCTKRSNRLRRDLSRALVSRCRFPRYPQESGLDSRWNRDRCTLVNAFGAKTAVRNRRFHPMWCSLSKPDAIYRSERTRTGSELPIRPRFVPDSFHMLSTGLSQRHVVIQKRSL